MKLISAVTNPPDLTDPEISKYFILHVDVFKDGLVVPYISRSKISWEQQDMVVEHLLMQKNITKVPSWSTQH